jgi:uncharacterized protein (TIGR03067 family)
MRCSATVGLVLLAGTASPGDPDRESATDRVALLIQQLGHDRYAKREEASRRLEAIGEPALGPLRTAASHGDPEIRRRVELVIQAIADNVTRRELKTLQGRWSLVSYETDGTRVKGEDMTHTFSVDGERWAICVGGQVLQAGTVRRIERTGKVNAIDLLITDGGGVGMTAESIFAVEGESLKYLNSGHPRATEFVTKPGDGRNYLTFHRAKR